MRPSCPRCNGSGVLFLLPPCSPPERGSAVFDNGAVVDVTRLPLPEGYGARIIAYQVTCNVCWGEDELKEIMP